MKLLSILMVAVLFLAACSGNQAKPGESSELQPGKNNTTEKKTEASADNLRSMPGFPLYNQHCLPCHQADGNGVPGMYPGLHNTEWVNGDVETLIGIVLHGKKGEIDVNGEYYNSVMAPLPYLGDQEVADILTYVRKRFGTDVSGVTPAEVKKVRAEG